MRLPADPRALALLIALVAALTLGGAWAFQVAGYVPCELCLKERLPYYAAVPVALLTLGAVLRERRDAALGGFALLIVIFVAGTALGLYHTGVEWKLWPGPSECSGTFTAPAKVDDFLKQLDRTAVVRCDEAAIRVFGLSLALWNALVCVALLGLANLGLLRSATLGRSGVARR